MKYYMQYNHSVSRLPIRLRDCIKVSVSALAFVHLLMVMLFLGIRRGRYEEVARYGCLSLWRPGTRGTVFFSRSPFPPMHVFVAGRVREWGGVGEWVRE